ncbi:hypothetical protein AAHZ94_07810 [Streptomyces sp. HSW2009]|uniref:hypothetical protein n=1 Tax=Streptomyces sp. HSW2009 TaxID=3142890 RepID=UPI0032EF9F6E
MRIRRLPTLVGLVALVGGSAIGVSTAQPAASQQSSHIVSASSDATAGDVTTKARRDVCFTGACGSATVKFTGRYTADTSMSVKDTKCDAVGPKMRIEASQYSYSQQKQYVWHGPWKKNTKGCRGGYQAWNSGFKGEDRLDAMRVKICAGSRCKTSSWMTN